MRASRGESRIRPAAPGFVSAWGGATWATPLNVTPVQPQLAMDARGTTLMVFRDQVSATINAVARPGAAGHFSLPASWSAPQVLSVPGDNVDQPQVAMDGGGDAVVVWRHVSGPATVQAVSRAADDPWSGWGAPQNLLVTASPVANPQVSANADGDVAVVWEQATATAVMASVRPASAGATAAFPAAAELASGASAEVGPAVAVDPAGNAVAAWREDGASTSAVRATAWDAAGPVVSSFTGPASGTAGDLLAFAAATDDVWSPLGAAPAWDFGDGSTDSGASVAHAWSDAGTYTVTMTRADVLGNTTTRTRTVTIAAAPAPPAPPAPPPSVGTPAPTAPATPAPAPPAAPSPAPVAPRLSGLAVRASGRSWTATFRAGARAVVRGASRAAGRVRTLAPRTVAAGSARVALGPPRARQLPADAHRDRRRPHGHRHQVVHRPRRPRTCGNPARAEATIRAGRSDSTIGQWCRWGASAHRGERVLTPPPDRRRDRRCSRLVAGCAEWDGESRASRAGAAALLREGVGREWQELDDAEKRSLAKRWRKVNGRYDIAGGGRRGRHGRTSWPSSGRTSRSTPRCAPCSTSRSTRRSSGSGRPSSGTTPRRCRPSQRSPTSAFVDAGGSIACSAWARAGSANRHPGNGWSAAPTPDRRRRRALG